MSYILVFFGLFVFLITLTGAINDNVQEQPWVIGAGFVGAFIAFASGVALYVIDRWRSR